MNVYVVTEGDVEKKVYRSWIPLINSDLVPIEHVDDVGQDSLYLISAGGYPAYFRVIEDAIKDVKRYPAFDRLVVTVDSEDMTRAEKLAEVAAFVETRPCAADVRIIVQHFCFEAWALGNRRIVRQNSQSQQLARYKRIHNVSSLDPELLPSLEEEDLVRAQFAEKYLRAALNDKFRNLSYSKSNPSSVMHRKYLQQLRLRLSETGHIDSFADFLTAFDA
jgi:hypothetical protein